MQHFLGENGAFLGLSRFSRSQRDFLMLYKGINNFSLKVFKSIWYFKYIRKKGPKIYKSENKFLVYPLRSPLDVLTLKAVTETAHMNMFTCSDKINDMALLEHRRAAGDTVLKHFNTIREIVINH